MMPPMIAPTAAPPSCLPPLASQLKTPALAAPGIDPKASTAIEMDRAIRMIGSCLKSGVWSDI
jgi:hypothetical protein